MSTCPGTTELVQYGLGTLATERLVAIARHVRGCSRCQQLIQQGQQVGPAPSGGNWELLENITPGRSGSVCRVRHRQLGIFMVAIRLDADLLEWLQQHDSHWLSRLQSLRHPHLASTLDCQTIDGNTYLLQEWIEGVTLEEVLARGPLNIRQACEWASQVAQALDYLDKQGVVHGDIRPGKILLTSGEQVKILGAGLTERSRKILLNSRENGSDSLVGIAEYCAPEQILDEPTDIRSDLYSLGCVLYRMLAGVAPFARASAELTLRAHTQAGRVGVRVHRPEVSEALSQVVMQLLARDPSARYQSAGEVIQALQQTLGPASSRLRSQPVVAPPLPCSEAIPPADEEPVRPAELAVELATHPLEQPQDPDEWPPGPDRQRDRSSRQSRRFALALLVYGAAVLLSVAMTIPLFLLVLHLLRHQGHVDIHVRPADAQVLIDEHAIDYSVAQAKTTYRLGVGKHILQVTKEGYIPYRERFLVEAGRTTVLDVELKPLQRSKSRDDQRQEEARKQP